MTRHLISHNVSIMNIITLFIPSAAIGYLLGSIPFGFLLAKLAGYGDIRRIGSGATGATNVLRTGHRWLALLTLLLDAAKGMAAVWLAAWIFAGGEAALIAGTAAVVGHVFPVWLGFKGGKGVATAVGVILALSWQVGLIVCVIWLLIALVSRISSVASLTAVTAAPLLMWWMSGDQAALFALAISALVIISHRENIARLIKRKEGKIKLR